MEEIITMEKRNLAIVGIVLIVLGAIFAFVVGPIVASRGLGAWFVFEQLSDLTSIYWAGFAVSIAGICATIAGIIAIVLALSGPEPEAHIRT